MDFYRAKEKNFQYIKYKKSLIHNTALIASEGSSIIAVFEYDIKNMEEAEIINFNIFEFCKETVVFKGLIDELMYWNPYLKRIIYHEDYHYIEPPVLVQLGFIEKDVWSLEQHTDSKVFKIDIEDITPEQLTVDKEKLDRVSSWIEKPEDIVVTCVKIGDKIVSIDGHSRLIAAYNKRFRHVYAYLEKDSEDIEFYKTCMKWCEEDGIFAIKDLAHKVVTSAEHEKLWINRCQAYLKEQRKL